MREIRFRAWITDMRMKEPLMIDDTEFYVIDGNTILEPVMREKQEAIVMQYIGIKDRAGKKIYEDDVALYLGYLPNNEREFKGVVHIGHWYNRAEDENGYGPYAKLENDEMPIWLSDKWEVVGNVHENSHLLEEPQ